MTAVRTNLPFPAEKSTATLSIGVQVRNSDMRRTMWFFAVYQPPGTNYESLNRVFIRRADSSAHAKGLDFGLWKTSP